mgnify:CR=1 FL=1
MKTQIILTTIFMTCIILSGFSQVEIGVDRIAINECAPLSELAINSVGLARNTAHVVADGNDNLSTALYAEAYDVSGFGDFTFGIRGGGDFGNTANRLIGVQGFAYRDGDYSDGRSTGVRGDAGNSTPGANYGVMGRLLGANSGAAVVGYDIVNHSGWGQVLPNGISYAGYFRGKGYFHDYLGLGEDDPQEKLHVNGGHVFVEGVGNGIIMEATTNVCFLVTLDAAGDLQTSPVSCP